MRFTQERLVLHGRFLQPHIGRRVLQQTEYHVCIPFGQNDRPFFFENFIRFLALPAQRTDSSSARSAAALSAAPTRRAVIRLSFYPPGAYRIL